MKEETLFVAGTVVGINGIRGKIKVYPPSETLKGFSPGEIIYLRGNDKQEKKHLIASIDVRKGYILLGIKGVFTVDEAKALLGCSVLIEKKRLQVLPGGEFYWFEIIGLPVFTKHGKLLGEIKEILPTGSNDVYIVRNSQKEYLIPATTSVIREIDLKKRRIVIHSLESVIES